MDLDEALYRWCHGELGGHGEWKERYERLKLQHDGRAYHNWGHIRHALGVAFMISLDENLEPGQWARVAFALFNHDRVYVPGAEDNEERSARLAIDDVNDEEVGRLIRLTKNHNVEAGDLLGGIVVDADLAILASPAERYHRYAAAIREEYAYLPIDDYRRGRRSFLESIAVKAGREELFRSPWLDHASALRNIETELEA
jgi:predicted metal-dependent HD superfamily phosphohydrolase